jgi:hypothetical protein
LLLSRLRRLQEVALDPKGNVFAELMRTVRVASLGQITAALFDVGGEYRRESLRRTIRPTSAAGIGWSRCATCPSRSSS